MRDITSIIVLAVSLLAILFTGCAKDAKGIMNESKDAIVTIYTFDEYGSPSGSGSGFFINADGCGVTNFHVLDGSVKATLKTSEGKEFEIDSVLVSDRKKDIVKFSIKNPSSQKFTYLSFSDAELSYGDKVYNISSPMGFEQSLSEGIISALREDSHGPIVQITAPISNGSSGSPILNDKGQVIAVATYLYKGGQALNFGVRLDDKILSEITTNEFEKRNRKFNKKDDFIILNIAASTAPQLKLNAIEFKKDATIAYFSYTNLNMNDTPGTIYCKPNKGDQSFTIYDVTNDKKYHMVSSTIGTSNKEATEVPIASTIQFKVNFPAIKNHKDIKEILIKENDKPRGWRFEDINLDDYRESLQYDMLSYQKNYAYACMHEGVLDYASAIFSSILDDDPEDEDALNALGIISFVQSNNKDAEDYFTEAIASHPTGSLAYKNRSKFYLEQGDKKKALQDLSTLINMDNTDMDCYVYRSLIYMSDEKWREARNDLDKIVESEDYKEEPMVYYYRAICSIYIKDFSSANSDIRLAYKYNDDPDLDRELRLLYNSIP